MTRFSIITVCRNCPDIKRTCDSIVNQTFTDFEWIVIDGASTDETLNILENYKNRITTLVSEKDNGAYNAMNKGIQLVKGEYVIFMNGGDTFYNNDVLNIVNSKISEHAEAKFVFGKANIVLNDSENEIIEYSNVKSYLDIKYKNICHQSIFYHKSLFEKYGNFDESYKILADWVFNIKVLYQNFEPSLYLTCNICNFFADGMSYNENYKKTAKSEHEKIKKIPLKGIMKPVNDFETVFYKLFRAIYRLKFVKVFFAYLYLKFAKLNIVQD